MSLQRFQTTDIVVTGTPVTKQGITLNRQAVVQCLRIELLAKQVTLDLNIQYIGDDNNPIALPGLVNYQRSLVASMTNLVDAATGNMICPSNLEYVYNPDDPDNKMLNPLLVGKTYMYDFEAFAALMHDNVNVADKVVEHIQYAFNTGQLD